MAVVPAKNGARLIGRGDLASNRAFATVEIKAGELSLRLRHLSAAEMLDYVAEDHALAKERDRQVAEEGRDPKASLTPEENQALWHRMALMVARLGVDADGQRAFTDDDVDLLLQKLPVATIVEAVQRVTAATQARMVEAGES